MVTARKNQRNSKPKPKSQRQFVIDAGGRPTAVILPIKEYEELMEDLFDLGMMADREHEPTIPWEEVQKRLRADGLLPD